VRGQQLDLLCLDSSEDLERSLGLAGVREATRSVPEREDAAREVLGLPGGQILGGRRLGLAGGFEARGEHFRSLVNALEEA